MSGKVAPIFFKYSDNLSERLRTGATLRPQCSSHRNQEAYMPLPKPEKLEDQRQALRYPLERVAKLEPADGGRVLFCLVVDTSDGGIRLRGFGEIEIPDQFVLNISGDGPARNGRYQVVWRHAPDVGAKLVEPAQDV
jgi:hypothetical protein